MKKRINLTPWYQRTGAYKWANRPRYTEPQFLPYVKAIGRLLLAWNDLHERLSTLFVMAMGGGWTDRPLAVWHGARMDYSKRQMLKTAIVKITEREKAGRDKVVEEILWVLEKADNLEGFRDDSAHTPLYTSANFLLADVLTAGDVYQLATAMIFPNTTFQNPRAMRLDKKNKDLLIEYQYARERITVLRDYVIAIDAAWSSARLPWPDRPDLPERRPKRARRNRGAGRRLK